MTNYDFNQCRLLLSPNVSFFTLEYMIIYEIGEIKFDKRPSNNAVHTELTIECLSRDVVQIRRCQSN